jgi:hypothetical protein
MTLALIGSVGACFARPCSPDYWSHVKAGSVPAPAPKSARGRRGSAAGSVDYTFAAAVTQD